MLLITLTIIAVAATLFLSIQHRMYRDPLLKQAGKSLMNVAMGSTLLLLSIGQLLAVELTTARLVVGILFLLLGLINIGFGVKNYRFYKSKLQQ
jgi:accessory gene regulator protein AgrB